MSASHIGFVGTSEAAVHGGTGSGSVFSPAAKGSSASAEASDIRVEMRDCGREEEG